MMAKIHRRILFMYSISLVDNICASVAALVRCELSEKLTYHAQVPNNDKSHHIDPSACVALMPSAHLLDE